MHLSLPRYRADIDGLRAAAVLAVVAFHASPAWVAGGFVGVDVFFVISGYLISTLIFENLDRGTFSFAEFYARRIRRIFPTLLLVLAASCVFGWIALLADEYEQLGKHVAAAAGFVSNFVLWGEAGYFDNTASTKPLLHLWSLGIEEQFYIVWPLLVWLAWKLRFSPFIILLFVAITSFWLNIRGVQKDAVGAFYSPQTRFWELLCGSLLAWVAIYQKDRFVPLLATLNGWLAAVVLRRRPESNGNALSGLVSLAGLFLIVFGIWRFYQDSGFPGAWAVVPVLGAVLVMLAGPDAWINRTILSNRVAVWLGLISFPLYLWHWPLLSFARIVEGEIPSRSVRVAAVLLSILLAWLTYRLLELPIRNGRSFARTKVAVLTSVMAALAVAGIAINASGGFPNRASLNLMRENQELARHIGPDDKDLNEACKRRYNLTGLIRYCNSTGGTPGIALIGDSHARALYDGLAILLKERGEDLLNIGGRLLLGVASYPAGDEHEQKINEGGIKATELAASDPAIRTVIMVSGAHRDAAAGPEQVFHLIDTPELTDRKKVFEIGLRKTLDAFAANKKKVIFVIDNPKIDFDPRACLTGRPFRLSTRARSPCAISRDWYAAMEGWYRELAFSVLKDYPGVRVFDAPAYLCDDTWCWASKDGRLLYRDIDHLSSAGSMYISRSLIEVMDGKTSKIMN